MKLQRGFTLIELVVVIIILGVLAVVAAPKFLNIKGDAQAAVLKGYAGAVKSMANLAHLKWQIDGQTEANIVTEDGAVLGMRNGFPMVTGYNSGISVSSAVGITKDSSLAYKWEGDTATCRGILWYPKDSDSSKCYLRITEACNLSDTLKVEVGDEC
ncbi:type II secretion system protein [Shewanella marina]|uniref:type II secretion system protein n=1 Tax=Shewanella marina TaxID=487319 RepID=UPI00046EC757|nr:type II secretion system protein [Shewanella marina]